jgi:hypothetical protein
VQTNNNSSITLSHFTAKKTKVSFSDVAQTDHFDEAVYDMDDSNLPVMLVKLIDNAAVFLRSLQKVVTQENHVAKQLKEYLELRTQYYYQVISKNKLDVQLLYQLRPQFLEMYEEVMQQEVAFVADLLQKAIVNGQIQHVNSRQLGYTIITMCDAAKHHAEQLALANGLSEANYEEAMDNYRFMFKLVVKGLLPKPVAA